MNDVTLTHYINSDKPHPKLSEAQEEEARDLILNSHDDLVTALAGYETKSTDIFPKIAFASGLTAKLSSGKYWEYIEKIAKDPSVKKFCRLLRVLACCPPSSAGIERLFSSGKEVRVKVLSYSYSYSLTQCKWIRLHCTFIIQFAIGHKKLQC